MVVVLLASAAARADGTVIARATDQRGGTWIPCGGIYSVGWVVYELVRVVQGQSPGPRFVGIHGCPDHHLRGELRLVLSTKRPPLQPRYSGKPMPDLPRRYVRSARPEAPAVTRRARRWLGQARADVERALKPTGTKPVDGDWVRYGDDLALRYAGGRVVALRGRVALGMDCVQAAAWLGYIAGKGRGFPLRKRWGCLWPGLSERHRLAPGLAGQLRDGQFEVWQRSARSSP